MANFSSTLFECTNRAAMSSKGLFIGADLSASADGTSVVSRRGKNNGIGSSQKQNQETAKKKTISIDSRSDHGAKSEWLS